MPDRLYDLADQLYRLAPWTWMREAQLVGLRHPETGEIAHISIMGRDGIHFCLALYLGPESLHRFNLIQEAEYEGITLSEEDTIGLIFESRQLQASFNPRSELEPRELAEIKRLGRKYRGENWPAFRSFHPGRAPGQLSANDAVWLAHAIEQLVQVAPILNDDPFGDYRAGANGETEILTRELRDGKWETTWTPFDNQLFEFPTPAPGSFIATKVADHSSLLDIECHFQLIPSPGTGNDQQRYFPYLVLSVDARSGFVFGIEVVNVENQSHDSLIASIPDYFLRQWDRHGIRPSALHCASQSTHALLEKTAGVFQVPLHRQSQLPALDEALASAMNFMANEH